MPALKTQQGTKKVKLQVFLADITITKTLVSVVFSLQGLGLDVTGNFKCTHTALPGGTGNRLEIARISALSILQKRRHN